MAFFSSTTWRDKLRPASYRGAEFSVEDDEGTFGRRVQVHEYPARDKPFTEDLGRATRRLSINAYLVGDDFMDKRDRLIVAIETAGPGTLIHPFYGEMQGSIDGQVRVTHSTAEGRLCRVSFQFVESGELSFPVSGSATDSQLTDSAGLFDNAIDSFLSGFSLEDITSFLQSDILADAASMLDKVTSAFRMIDEGVSAAMRLLQGDLSVLLMPPGSASDFVHALQNAWREGSRLTGDTSDMVTSVRTMSGVSVDPGLAPRGVWSTDPGTLKTRTTLSNLLATAVRTTALSEAVKVVATLPKPRIAASLSRGSRTDSSSSGSIITVSHPALDGSVATAATGAGTVATWDDLTSVRTALNDAIDTELLRTADNTLFMALTTLRSDLNRDITDRLAQVERMAERTPPDVLPAVVLAAQWYDDASRENEILDRNSIPHPGFLPVLPLRVPVK